MDNNVEARFQLAKAVVETLTHDDLVSFVITRLMEDYLYDNAIFEEDAATFLDE